MADYLAADLFDWWIINKSQRQVHSCRTALELERNLFATKTYFKEADDKDIWFRIEVEKNLQGGKQILHKNCCPSNLAWHKLK